MGGAGFNPRPSLFRRTLLVADRTRKKCHREPDHKENEADEKADQKDRVDAGHF
jgi:hypothetical protein